MVLLKVKISNLGENCRQRVSFEKKYRDNLYSKS